MLRQKKREEKVLWEVAVQRAKQDLAAELTEKFPWLVRKLTMTRVKLMRVEDMFKLAEKLELNKLQADMATRVQQWWRKKMARRRYSFQPHIERWKATVRIQNAWKNFRWRKLMLFIRHRKAQAALKIQRAARRTLLRPNDQNYKFIEGRLHSFTPLRQKLLEDFQVKIAYLYRKHLKLVAEKKRIAEEKRRKKQAALAKKKTKGGKAKKGKKKKAQTMTAEASKALAEGKEERNNDELEPGLD